MRGATWTVTIALTLAAAIPAESFGQWSPSAERTRGMFGDRTLGQPLQPRPRTYVKGIERAPGGAFIGRVPGGTSGTTFSSPARAPAANRTTSRPPGPVVNTFDYGRVEIGKPLVGAQRSAPRGASQAQGDVWFRGDAPSRRSPTRGAASTPSGGTPASGAPPTTTGSAASGRQMWSNSLPGSGPMRYVRGEPGSRQTGFGRSATAFESTDARLSRRISQNPGITSETGVVVSIKGSVATLRGSVATPRDRTLAGHLARFEPGVVKVDNRLVVPGEE